MAIDRSFPEHEHDDVAELLQRAVGGNQLRSAILVLAYGDLSILVSLVEKSQLDDRNVLMFLELPSLEFPELSNMEVSRRYTELGLDRIRFGP